MNCKFFKPTSSCIIFESFMPLEMSHLKNEIERLKEENKNLRLKLDDANAVVDNLKRIFTEGQIRKMSRPGML